MIIYLMRSTIFLQIILKIVQSRIHIELNETCIFVISDIIHGNKIQYISHFMAPRPQNLPPNTE